MRIKIELAKEQDAKVLALLARVTWSESHSQYVDTKNDVLKYLNENFSVSKTRKDLDTPNIIFYIIYVDELPVGYAKLVLNVSNKAISSQNNCRLERIFIQDDFIPLKIGQQLLNFVQEKASALQLDTMWLTASIRNKRALRFYEKNNFINVGAFDFVVNEKAYKNIIFSKNIISCN